METPEPDLPAMSYWGRFRGSKRQLINTIRPNPQLRHRHWWLGTMLEGRYGPQPGGPTLENMRSSLGNHPSHALSTCSKPRSIFSTPSESDGAALAAEERRNKASCYPGCSSRGGVESMVELHVFPGEMPSANERPRSLSHLTLSPSCSGELTAEAWQDFSVVEESPIWILVQRRSCLRAFVRSESTMSWSIIDALYLVTSLSMCTSFPWEDAHHRNDA